MGEIRGMDDHAQIRRRIRDRIDELDLKVRGVSIAAGLGETTLRNYLKGMTASVTLDTLARLAKELKVSDRWLLYGENAEVSSIFDAIPAERRDHALDILKTFVDGAGLG